MSDTSRTDDSIPSLSSYPPAFVSLITTFITRAEEAETRAHKALVILRTKDKQVVQLQERLEVLEKIASRLEEVMVPPLDLPRSSESDETEEMDSYHPRDLENVGVKEHQTSLKTIYERYTNSQQQRSNPNVSNNHNCYSRCQHLLDGLERSNQQLREALTVESEQRVKDHEQYVTTLAQVTKAFKKMQADQSTNSNPECDKHQALQRESFSKSFCEQITSVLGAAGDTKDKIQVQDGKNNGNQMILLDKEDFKKSVDMAENIVRSLQIRLEKGVKRSLKKRKPKQVKKNNSYKSFSSSTSSYHTPNSLISFKPKYQSLHCFYSALKRNNKRLKTKHVHVCEKFRESLNLCKMLQENVDTLREQSKIRSVSIVGACTQTENHSSPLQPLGRPERLPRGQSVHLLQGRLEAAAKVMNRQCKQLQELQHQLATNHNTIDSLKKRLSRAESALAGKDLLGETTKQQLQESQNNNSSLRLEIHQLKDSVNQLKAELSSQIEMNSKIEKQKENSEQKCEEVRRIFENKLSSLSSALQQQEDMSQRATSELQTKLSCLREQLIAHVTEASDRLVTADSKIQELYLGIETFLKLLFSVNKGPSSMLTPSSQAQAVQMASDILQVAPGEVQLILHSTRYENHLVVKWMRECNRLVHNKVFAKNLGRFLLDAVVEANIL